MARTLIAVLVDEYLKSITKIPELNKNKSTSSELRNVETIWSCFRVICKFGIVNINVPQLLHAEIVSIDVLNLNKHSRNILVQVDCVQIDTTRPSFDVRISLSVN